jgi:hypothetical protein
LIKGCFPEDPNRNTNGWSRVELNGVGVWKGKSCGEGPIQRNKDVILFQVWKGKREQHRRAIPCV